MKIIRAAAIWLESGFSVFIGLNRTSLGLVSCSFVAYYFLHSFSTVPEGINEKHLNKIILEKENFRPRSKTLSIASVILEIL
jgi:hypothetical protein